MVDSVFGTMEPWSHGMADSDKSQLNRFKEAARELGTDDKERFDQRHGRIT